MDALYLSLLGLAEHFRTSKPPDIRRCIQCLMAVFKSTTPPPPKVEARTHLQLGTILYNHTKNVDLAKSHLEQAWALSQNLQGFDDVKYESASLLAEVAEGLHQESLEQAGRYYVSSNEAKGILRKALELSQATHVYWHCRLLFQLAQMHAKERDYASALGLLGVGIDYAQGSSAQFTRILFTLSKAMLLLTSGSMAEAADTLNQTGPVLEAFGGTPHQKEYLKVFFLVLQVSQYLIVGQVKSVKPGLKQLQQSVQTITQPNWPTDEDLNNLESPADNFMWLPKEHMCVMVYLVTIAHSMQAGYMEKAQKYSEKALAQVEKMKTIDKRPLLLNFQRMILEHMVLCQLVMGHRGAAIKEMNNLSQLLYHPHQFHQQQPQQESDCTALATMVKYQLQLGRSSRPQMHSLLGLYAMSLDYLDVAEQHFHMAVQCGAMLGPHRQSKELLAFVQLNAAVIRLMKGRKTGGSLLAEDAELVERLVTLDKIPEHSHGLKAAALYVRGLHAFLAGRYNEAKSFLRDTLKMANAEDLNRLTSVSLVLLGHIFLALNNSRESMNMVTPAMQLASKIPDLSIQLWAASVQKSLFRNCGDSAKEQDCANLVQHFASALQADQREASQLAEHHLLQWFGMDDAHPPPLIGFGVSDKSTEEQQQQQSQSQQQQQQQQQQRVPQEQQQQEMVQHQHQQGHYQQQHQQPPPPQYQQHPVQRHQQIPGAMAASDMGMVPLGPASNPAHSSEGSAPATPATPMGSMSGPGSVSGSGTGGQTPPTPLVQHQPSPAHYQQSQQHHQVPMPRQSPQTSHQLQQQQQQQQMHPYLQHQYRHPQQQQQPQQKQSPQQQAHAHQQHYQQPQQQQQRAHQQAQPQQQHVTQQQHPYLQQQQQQHLQQPQQQQQAPPPARLHQQQAAATAVAAAMSPQQGVQQSAISPHAARQHQLYQQPMLHQHMMAAAAASTSALSSSQHQQMLAAAAALQQQQQQQQHHHAAHHPVVPGLSPSHLSAGVVAASARQHPLLQHQAHLQPTHQAMMPQQSLSHLHHSAAAAAASLQHPQQQQTAQMLSYQQQQHLYQQQQQQQQQAYALQRGGHMGHHMPPH